MMQQFNDSDLNQVMNQINDQIAQAVVALEQYGDTDQFYFMRTFRDALIERNFDEGTANKITANFNLEIPDGKLDKQDLNGSARMYADWVKSMIDQLRQTFPNESLIDELVTRFDLELKLK